jgi:arylsulfatase A-like enzyme
MKFTAFRVNPLCAPTRASLLTGQSNLEAGLWRAPSKKEDVERELAPGVQLLPQYLKTAGYATGIFGKWHLGYTSPDLPNDRGFDEFVGFLGGSHAYRARRNGRILKNGKPLETDKHLTDLFADSAEEFIRANAAKPFFCYVPFNAVHGPLRSEDRPADSAKPEWLAKYDHLPPARRDYAAVVSHADERIGRLAALIRELDLPRKTLIVCLSDNGAMTDKYPGNNGPLRGQKGETYEGGIRVPAVMAWDGIIPPGSVSHANAVHFDIFATFLDIAGIPIPQTNGKHPVHGVNLFPHLRSGGSSQIPNRHLFWDLYGKMAAVHGDWKIVGTIDNHHGKWDRALAQIEQTKFELYNLKSDLAEKNDLAETHPEIHGDLKRRYVAWFRGATR